jgi:glycerophosphoryl diester phosphodiesterase
MQNAMMAESWLMEKPIAHRGLFDNVQIPENSLGAFELAIARGFAIELDVRLTKDCKAVVFHDIGLARVTGTGKSISECDWEDIKNLKLFGTDQTIPLFQSALNFIDGRVPVLVEIKNEKFSSDLERSVAILLDKYSGHFAVQSFNPLTLYWFKKNRAKYCRGQLTSDFINVPEMPNITKFLLRNMYLNALSRPHFIAYDVRAGDTLFFTGIVNKYRLPMILWTIDTKEKLALCQELGANFIFESPILGILDQSITP